MTTYMIFLMAPAKQSGAQLAATIPVILLILCVTLGLLRKGVRR